MSQDWMKIEKHTPGKSEVRKIASIMGISRHDAFGRCFDVWCYFDTNSVDGRVVFADRPTIDDLAGLPGFALAMIQVGWLIERHGDLSLPNFDRHNGETAKQRSLKARRQAKLRSRIDDLDENSGAPCATQTPHEAPLDKRREENTPLIPPSRGEEKKNRRHRRGPPKTDAEVEAEMAEKQRARKDGTRDERAGVSEMGDSLPPVDAPSG